MTDQFIAVVCSDYTEENLYSWLKREKYLEKVTKNVRSQKLATTEGDHKN